MILDSVKALIAQATQPNPTGETIKMVAMLAMMGFLFYFMAIRPQRARAKQLEALIKSLKAGDRVVTSSGIIGVVVAVRDKSVSLRSADAKLEVLKSAVSEITEREAEPTNS
jgi:preprotein translocase subunit YajC